MLDRTIPFCNTIMKCSDYEYRNVELPDGFSIISYQSGHEKEWAKLEYAIGDFDSVTEAERYFVKTYLQIPELLPNILFALNKDGDVVGSCIAWQDMRGINSVSSLHWLVVDDLHQKKGLGKSPLHCCYEHLCKAQGPSCLHPHTALELESHPFVPFAWIQAPEDGHIFTL